MSGCFRSPLRVALLDCVSRKTGFISGVLCLTCYQGQISSGIRQDSVDMALLETGSNHNDSGFGRTTDESVKADDSSEQVSSYEGNRSTDDDDWRSIIKITIDYVDDD